MSHPYTDPYHSGLVQLTPSQRLMNADLYRKRHGGSMMHENGVTSSPLSGMADSVGAVLSATAYGRQKQENPKNGPVASDADPPTQGVTSDGDDLYHVRDNKDGTATAAHIGTDDLDS